MDALFLAPDAPAVNFIKSNPTFSLAAAACIAVGGYACYWSDKKYKSSFNYVGAHQKDTVQVIDAIDQKPTSETTPNTAMVDSNQLHHWYTNYSSNAIKIQEIYSDDDSQSSSSSSSDSGVLELSPTQLSPNDNKPSRPLQEARLQTASPFKPTAIKDKAHIDPVVAFLRTLVPFNSACSELRRIDKVMYHILEALSLVKVIVQKEKNITSTYYYAIRWKLNDIEKSLTKDSLKLENNEDISSLLLFEKLEELLDQETNVPLKSICHEELVAQCKSALQPF